jgi:hypothetical protein
MNCGDVGRTDAAISAMPRANNPKTARLSRTATNFKTA